VGVKGESWLNWERRMWLKNWLGFKHLFATGFGKGFLNPGKGRKGIRDLI